MVRTVSASSTLEPKVQDLPKEEESGWDRFVKKISECWRSCFGGDEVDISAIKTKFPKVARVSRFEAINWDVKSVKDRISEQNHPVIAPAPQVKPPIPPKKIDPLPPPAASRSINEMRREERTLVKADLVKLAEALKSVDTSKSMSSRPRKHKNLARTCYMNAGLQILSHMHPVSSSFLKKLLRESDMTWKAGDSYESLENRLAAFAPITFNKQSLAELEEKKTAKEFELNALAPDLFDQKLLLVNEIQELSDHITQAKQIAELEGLRALLADEVEDPAELRRQLHDIDQGLCIFEDRVLFKWSYLLYLKAARYGTQADLDAALLAHHRVCYAIARASEFKQAPGEMFNGIPTTCYIDNEIDTYFSLWHEMMGIQLNTTTYKKCTDGLITNIERAPLSTIHIDLQPGDSFLNGVKSVFEGKTNDFTEYRKVNEPAPRFLTFCLQRPATIDGKVTEGIPFGGDGSYEQSNLNLDGYFGEKAEYRLVSFSLQTNSGGEYGGHYKAYLLHVIDTKGNAKWFECNDSSIHSVKKVEDLPLDRACTLTYAKVRN